ncbi:MAG: amidohydrolase family protein [Dehalococcoidia bacterium]
MIIDNHVHVFPDQAGPEVGPDPRHHVLLMQQSVRDYWGRMVTSHKDPKYIPGADEDVGFTVGQYGRFHWKKHGEDCWLQRGPVTMEVMEHTPEQMLAHMDFIGVDMGVIHADYLDVGTGRESYFLDCIRRWPDRFIGTASIDYDLTRDDEYLRSEIKKLTGAVTEDGFKAFFASEAMVEQPLDDPRCDPLWAEVVRLGVPAYINTGFNPRAKYLAQIQCIENILKRFPELVVIDSHVGGNILHPRDPQYVDSPREFNPLFDTGRFYLELGYVLAYENVDVWGRDYEYPYPRHRQIIQTIYENFGPRVLVWGSDIPWCFRTCTYQQNLDLIRLHTDFMTEEDRALVLGGNLARLLGIG